MDRMPDGWHAREVSTFLKESREPGTNGSVAKKLTVKLYGKGVVSKEERNAGSAQTRFYRRSVGQFVYSKLDFLNGAFGIVPAELDGYETTLDVPAFDFVGSVDPNWFLYLVSRPAFYKEKSGLARGSRKARRVSPSDFLAIEIPTPSLPEQEKIAEILGSVDEAIQATQAVIDQTRKVKQGLLQQILTRGIGHTRFKQTEIGEIPESWDAATVEDLAQFSGGNGFTPEEWSDSGLPIIRIQNLNGSKDFNYFSGEPKEKWIIEPGTLLFAWAGVKGVSFGPCLWPGPRGVLNQHIYRITPHEGVDKTWMYGILRLITARIEANAHGFKASLLHVRKNDIVGQVVPLPPPEEQTRIGGLLADQDVLSTSQQQQLESLQRLKQGLQADLLSGRVRVKV